MDFMSVKEASLKWGISERRVRALCESGRIEGVTRCGDWVWSIPCGTQRPADGRTLRFIKNRSLRTGSQDYKAVDALRSKTKNVVFSDMQKVGIILQSLLYDSISITEEQINLILNHENQNLDLSTQILVLNMKSCLDNLPDEVSETSICNINRRILLSVDEKAAGTYKHNGTQAQEMEALLSQYAGPWSVLHPVARSAFLFAELMRIQPFKKANTPTAFAVLTGELIRAKLPPAIFDTDNLDALKAALASSNIRGNSQNLVSMILESLSAADK